MTDCRQLQQNRRMTAFLTSPGGWGEHGDARVHLRYMELAPTDRLVKPCSSCPKQPVRPPATHLGMCNGVALMSGCEWHVRQWVQQGDRR